ncbi:hypothetical protein BPJM79_70064 [Bacillus pumilus]
MAQYTAFQQKHFSIGLTDQQNNSLLSKHDTWSLKRWIVLH